MLKQPVHVPVSLVLLLAVAIGCNRTSAPVGLSMPGKDGDLQAMDAGEIHVFVFARIDCPISNRYVPEISRFCDEYSAGVNWWFIYPNPSLTDDAIADHVTEYDIPCTTYHDKDQKLVRQTGATITPEVAVYGPDNQLVYCGRIDDRFVDFGKTRPEPTKRDLEEALKAAMAGEAVVPNRQPAVGCYIADLK